MAGTRAVMNSCRVLLFFPPLCLMVESVWLHAVHLESPESILSCAGTAKCWQGDAGSGKTKCLSHSQCTNIPVSSLSCLLLHAGFEVLHSQLCITARQRAGECLQTWRTWRWTGPGLWPQCSCCCSLVQGDFSFPSLLSFLPCICSCKHHWTKLCLVSVSCWAAPGEAVTTSWDTAVAQGVPHELERKESITQIYCLNFPLPLLLSIWKRFIFINVMALSFHQCLFT